jgi:ribonuclease BN (tRNA processing enzyme)
MHIQFIGVGEACDPLHCNTSVLVSANDRQILLDCGFSVPHHFFAGQDDPDRLDAVYLSHFHGDHFFGIPLLLLRFWEMGRSKKLVIVGQKECPEKVKTAMELAYPGFIDDIGYPLEFIILQADSSADILDLHWRATLSLHSQTNLGLRLDGKAGSIYYSGDGRPTETVAELAAGVDCIIHEAFRMENEIQNHGSIRSSIALWEATGAKRLALVHLERTFRKTQSGDIAKLLERHPDLMLPEEGMQLTL